MKRRRRGSGGGKKVGENEKMGKERRGSEKNGERKDVREDFKFKCIYLCDI